jgi:uncharacterized protein (TIGR03792 family)
MVIEWLKVQVAEALRETFIQKDEAIWTATLARYPGFLGKQVWINPEKPEEVILVIHWADKEAWQSIPADVLEATEKQFVEQMGAGTYKIVEGVEYQVRKFPSS